jgi:peptidoglycan/xylan/chitin deacetylase (PgdA/CDA1 family)
MKSLLSFTFFLFTIALFPQKNEVVSLVYHRFGDDRFPSTNISLTTFEEQLRYLKEAGFQSITFSTAIERLSNHTVDGKSVAITVDDGYLSFFENGLPLLRKYGFTATLFVNTSTVGGADYMDWNQIKAAQDQGIEIGNHSDSHPFFLDVEESARLNFFRQEVEICQSLMAEKLGKKPIVFAYPYGEMDQGMKPILQELGFIGAAAQNSGVIHEGSDFFQCARFPMSESFGGFKQFKEKVEMHALQVISAEALSSGYYGTQDKPRINIEFKQDDLFLQSIQCFVQGGKCAKSIQVLRDGLVKMALRPQDSLTARRTLFTVTVHDKQGKWHWYSFLWVIPKSDPD